MDRSALGIALAATVLAGCYGQVVTGQHKLAPSQDVELGVVYRAKPGTSFSDVAEKTLNVSVAVAGRSSSQTQIYLFARQYTLVTADIDWDIEWVDAEHGRVEFFSYPPGVSKYRVERSQRRSASTPIAFIEVARRAG